MTMHTKLLGSVALSALLIAGLTGCGSDDDTVAATAAAAPAATISPYTRVAVIENPAAVDDAAIEAIADKIAHYVTLTDETAADGHAFPGGWVIAGANRGAGGETYGTGDLLPIPSAGTAAGGKSRIVEFCNGGYATMATNTGRFHGSALPCEVSVHSDGTNIYVDMLNADAIFNLFFTDISDPTGALEDVASAVNKEIRELVLAALDDTTVAAQSPLVGTVGTTEAAAAITTAIPYTESTLAMGPEFTQTQIDNEVALKNPYIVFEYTNGNTFATGTDDKALGEAIIATMGTNGTDVYTNVPGVSAGSGWKSARPDTLAIPGVRVIEACSGKYATLATKLGNEYLTALPCEITVLVDENDPTKLTISFLSPNFMFGTMFQGAVEQAYADGKITKDDVIQYSTLADVVFADLRLIVDTAIQNYDPTLSLQPQP
ncbi:MAG: hypothetical protein WBF77_08920 [Sulfurimonadaceae bacterium]